MTMEMFEKSKIPTTNLSKIELGVGKCTYWPHGKNRFHLYW